jgi:hypothetical protein
MRAFAQFRRLFNAKTLRGIDRARSLAGTEIAYRRGFISRAALDPPGFYSS